MAAKTGITVEEFLQMHFENPEPEYVDGEIVERPLPDLAHSKAQTRLIKLFSAAGGAKLCECVELTVRLPSNRIRVADFAVFQQEPADRFPSTPPFVIAEIVSKDDRYTEIIQKLEDYRNWGVPHIWLVDPSSRKLSVYGAEGLAAAAELTVPELDLRITPAELFAD